ncbi:hypothetical protein KI387_037490, partial [Taxus chinensis]
KFPKACELDCLPSPGERAEIVLVDPNTKKWKIRSIWHQQRFTLSGGWKYFSSQNGLEEGDVCIFEQVDCNKKTFILKVHIFRVLENCIPYKERSDDIKTESEMVHLCKRKSLRIREVSKHSSV